MDTNAQQTGLIDSFGRTINYIRISITGPLRFSLCVLYDRGYDFPAEIKDSYFRRN